MPQATITSLLYKILGDSAILVGPPLLAATVVAFVVGIFQAVTQTQEQTLPQTVKMVLIVVLLLSLGKVLAAPFLATSTEIFTTFHRYQR